MLRYDRTWARLISRPSPHPLHTKDSGLVSYAAMRRRAHAARPATPLPNSQAAAGRGTGAGVPFELAMLNPKPKSIAGAGDDCRSQALWEDIPVCLSRDSISLQQQFSMSPFRFPRITLYPTRSPPVYLSRTQPALPGWGPALALRAGCSAIRSLCSGAPRKQGIVPSPSSACVVDVDRTNSMAIPPISIPGA